MEAPSAARFTEGDDLAIAGLQPEPVPSSSVWGLCEPSQRDRSIVTGSGTWANLEAATLTTPTAHVLATVPFTAVDLRFDAVEVR
jgi:hypothetical protein